MAPSRSSKQSPGPRSPAPQSPGSQSPGSRRRRTPRHGPGASHGQRTLRPKVVAWTAVVFVMVVAGLTALLLRAFGPADDSAAAPVPQVTVTAAPDQAQPAVAVDDGTGPITAQEAPEGGATPGPPLVVVEDWIDLSQHSFDDPASPWVVVNKARPLDPQSWEPAELEVVEEAELVPQAAAALQRMIAAAGEQELELRTGTGYRTYGYQEFIYADYVDEFGQDSADQFSARPGFSEHQTGWAVDLYSSEQCRLQECFAREPAGVWVTDHAHEYGFVIRYPRGEEEVTGYQFEPWHLRYVGPELATFMREQGISTLEHAFNLPAAPDYE